ncbi:MAG: amino acid adenylation domain-containing protein [Nitrospirae bacterium]|nr:amino acid adenylation domain-containing protein [Nitrospirota bacterium]
MPELLHNLLTESAGKYADKAAVTSRGKEITYGDLNALSNQLSLGLDSRNVRTGDRIGIYLHKSIDAVTAIFGILKSGACYVPLDPMSPVERQILIVNDCSLEYLITSSKKLPDVRQILQSASSLKYIFVIDIAKEECQEQISGVNIIFKDEIFKTPGTSMEQPQKQVTESNLAYILYTSGSTGQPKGVMIPHKAALAFVNWAWKCFNVNSDDIVSSHAPFHFDLSIFDIFAAVKAGATICIVPHELSSFPRSLSDFIEKQKISTWYSVPSILTQLVLYGNLEQKNLSSLRQVLFAGEVFPSKYLRRLMELIPHAKYYNLYGPTETNVITYYHVAELPDVNTSIPIGVPCDGVKTYIVNKSGAIVKNGEMGELYVSAPTLMDGYWKDSKKTESVLFKNPSSFLPSANETIYKTGDLVNYNQNGVLEYHGRGDAMIKSRGYRIELGEIETALLSHPDINEAAVLGIPHDEIGTWIKAFVASKKDSAISEKAVQHFCSQKLPHYMVPEAVAITDSLPKTSTGKIDRKKLEKESI